MGQASWRQGEPMALVELPTPVPVDDEVLVAVRAAGVNPVDWKLRAQGPLRIAARLTSPPPPIVVGCDFAGVVVAVGPRADVSIGDAVVGGVVFARRQRGSYADHVLVRADQVCVLPAGFDLDVAAALPIAGVTAFRAVVDVGRARAGDRVLILGASGGVGHLAVQVAKLQGAASVGVCSAASADFVRGLGADVIVDYTAGDPLMQARAHGPFKVVIDCVGAYSSAACRALLAPGGRHVVVSGDSFSAALSMLVPPFSTRLILGRPTRARLRRVVDAIAAGGLRVVVAERIPLVEAERAHATSRAGRTRGKIVLVP